MQCEMEVTEATIADDALATADTRWLSAISLRIRLTIIAFLAIVVALLFVWMERESIARNIVGSMLDEQGIAATYEFESLDLDQQILRNLVVGDPAKPDITIEKLIISLRPDLSGPKIDSIHVEKMRVFGRYTDNVLSFGTLDKLLFAPSDSPPELPDFTLHLIDSRALMVTDFGDVGVALEGTGHLRDGFKAFIAASGKSLQADDCRVEDASIYGTFLIDQLEPKFVGPARIKGFNCADSVITTAQATTNIDLTVSRNFKSVTGALDSQLDVVGIAGATIKNVAGSADFAIKDQDITGQMAWTATQSRFDMLSAQKFTVKGDYAVARDFASASFAGAANGRGLNYAGQDWQALRQQIVRLSETPIGPIAAKIVAILQQRAKNAALATQLTFSKKADDVFVQIPALKLTGGNGAGILTASDIAIDRLGTRNRTQVSGTLQLGGAGLPDWAANIIPSADGSYRVAITGSPYAAQQARLALQGVEAVFSPSANIAFTGAVLLSGPLPGGNVQGLKIPLNGQWSATNGLQMLARCENIRFDRLMLSGLSSGKQSIRLCPERGGAMLAQGRQGYRFAATTSLLDLKAKLGAADLQIQSEAVQISLPGASQLGNVRLTIGSGESATRLKADSLLAQFDDQITGRFEGLEAQVGVVPLLLTRGNGQWSFTDSVFSLNAEEWFVRDTNVPARFAPLLSNNAQLQMADGMITASGDLREPLTAIKIANIDIIHALSSVNGRANFTIDALRFDNRLQPDMLTPLALGVIANVKGSVSGAGLIKWGGDSISSSGAFRTADMDLAAAFGPVTGLSGEIVFTDLLNMITAPDQIARIKQINPGVAVDDGVVRYALIDGLKMNVKSGEWPFAGGRLIMQETILALADDTPRSLNFKIEGLNAAAFLQRLEFENLSATGIFDGQLPMVFDQNGGQIIDGFLRARDGGGSIAYLGDLTYEDMGAIANFAFNALREIKYNNLEIDMNGAIDGELVTNVRFSGLQQGDSASRNFITKQLNKLPIRFNVNIRAPFMQLMTTTRSLYDTSFLRDPAITQSINALTAAQIEKAARANRK